MRNNHPGHRHNGHQAKSPNSLSLTITKLSLDNLLQYSKTVYSRLKQQRVRSTRSDDPLMRAVSHRQSSRQLRPLGKPSLPPTTDPPTTLPPPDNSLYGHCSLSAAQNVKVRDVWMRCSSKKKVWIPFQVLSIVKTSFWEFGNKKVSILMNWGQSTKSIETMWNESKVKRKLTQIVEGSPSISMSCRWERKRWQIGNEI